MIKLMLSFESLVITSVLLEFKKGFDFIGLITKQDNELLVRSFSGLMNQFIQALIIIHLLTVRFQGYLYKFWHHICCF